MIYHWLTYRQRIVNLPVDRMEAKYIVGDEVWTKVSGPWRITARYYRKRTNEILYDLRFANGVTINKNPEEDTFSERQWAGFGLPQGEELR